jgi:hypothetical protein
MWEYVSCQYPGEGIDALLRQRSINSLRLNCHVHGLLYTELQARPPVGL